MSGWKPLALLLVLIAGCAALLAGMLQTTYGLLGSGTADQLILDPTLYHDSQMPTLWELLKHRILVQPFNLIASLVFALAIAHTLMANTIHGLAKKMGAREENLPHQDEGYAKRVKWFLLELVYFLGEVEIVFGLWAFPLLFLLAMRFGWDTAASHFDGLDYTEPLFVIVMMTLAGSYPIVRFAEKCLQAIVSLCGGSQKAWWITLLTVAPLLGSFITEPAAMTLAAMLLATKFYLHRPTPRLAYATLGLLFCNVSIGGVLTHFAAPPVLMVAKKWDWSTPFMMSHFGINAVIGIALATFLYAILFRKDFRKLTAKPDPALVDDAEVSLNNTRVPGWITLVHILLMIVVISNNHYPAVFLGAFLLFLGFHEVTKPFQSPLSLRSPLLVGFFLAGLVVHVSFQAWWIEPPAPTLQRIATNGSSRRPNGVY